jgi:hypothetical protein
MRLTDWGTYARKGWDPTLTPVVVAGRQVTDFFCFGSPHSNGPAVSRTLGGTEPPTAKSRTRVDRVRSVLGLISMSILVTVSADVAFFAGWLLLRNDRDGKPVYAGGEGFITVGTGLLRVQ